MKIIVCLFKYQWRLLFFLCGGQSRFRAFRFRYWFINSSPPGQNGRHFDRRCFKWSFLNENGRIPIQISVKFVPGSPIEHKPTVVQVMAWCRTGDEPLPGPMMTQFTDAYMWHIFFVCAWHSNYSWLIATGQIQVQIAHFNIYSNLILAPANPKQFCFGLGWSS